MQITLEQTVDKMVQSLKEKAKMEDISIEEIQDAFGEKDGLNQLDDIFGDGGEVRCEYFCDLAIEYALQFGEFDGTEFHNARWDATEKAMESFVLL